MKELGGWNFWRKLEIPAAIFLILIVNISYQKKFTGNSIKAFITPPKTIQYFHFGNALLFADFLWIRWIQNIDQCDAIVTKEVKLGKIQKYPLQDNCSNGWGSQMLDRLTLLDPYFKSAYVLGATVSSVLVEDGEGLDSIFARGIEHYPKDWLIPYRAAYNAQFVMNDKVKAAEYLSIAGRNGAPTWVYALAARLYSQEGAYDLGIKNLQDLLSEENLDEKYRAQIESRLKDLLAKKAQKSEGT